MYNLIIMSGKPGCDNGSVVHSEHNEQTLAEGLQCEKDHNIVLYIIRMYGCACRPITQKLIKKNDK